MQPRRHESFNLNRLDWLESQMIYLTRRIFDAEQVIMRLEGAKMADDRPLSERLEENKRTFEKEYQEVFERDWED